MSYMNKHRLCSDQPIFTRGIGVQFKPCYLKISGKFVIKGLFIDKGRTLMKNAVLISKQKTVQKRTA